ncbi:MAG: hypothetical protein KDD55_04290, partial [Bdellovibrionales bacterium]|nr:hypothetical protein [Bdellovibrionales bacterium]
MNFKFSDFLVKKEILSSEGLELVPKQVVRLEDIVFRRKLSLPLFLFFFFGFVGTLCGFTYLTVSDPSFDSVEEYVTGAVDSSRSLLSFDSLRAPSVLPPLEYQPIMDATTKEVWNCGGTYKAAPSGTDVCVQVVTQVRQDERGN